MKTLNSIFAFIFIAFLFVSCEPKEQPIAYGQVNCAHCQMTVSDKRYGAELVSKTNKAYFFDSAECLMSYLQANPPMASSAAMLRVTDFTKPEMLLDAEKATFLQSKNLPSPMGMFLTALPNEATAKKLQQESGGRIMNWEQAKAAVKNNEKPE